MVLKVENVTGGYASLPVIKNLSFEIKAQELVGLIGLNGAGKSTTINHIIGLLQPFKGKITLEGLTLAEDPLTYHADLAYIPETPILYPELTLQEHLDMTIMAYNLDRAIALKEAERLLKIFRLENKLNWFPANFSKGMKQKVMIVCAFLVPAKLYIIDEPFVGLDPLAIRDLLTLIKEKKAAGSAILMSTHVLSTAQDVCDRFIMLDQGTIKAQGTLTKLQSQYQHLGRSLAEIYLGLTAEG